MIITAEIALNHCLCASRDSEGRGPSYWNNDTGSHDTIIGPTSGLVVTSILLSNFVWQWVVVVGEVVVHQSVVNLVDKYNQRWHSVSIHLTRTSPSVAGDDDLDKVTDDTNTRLESMMNFLYNRWTTWNLLANICTFLSILSMKHFERFLFASFIL